MTLETIFFFFLTELFCSCLFPPVPIKQKASVVFSPERSAAACGTSAVLMKSCLGLISAGISVKLCLFSDPRHRVALGMAQAMGQSWRD